MVRCSGYCGGPAISLADWFWPRESSVSYAASWPQLVGRTVIGTYRGRTAISLACRVLGLGEGDEILVPSYNCGTEIDALLKSGLTPVAYRISKQCEIDLDDLASRKTNRTRAVYLIHYFGWEQPMKGLKRWCEEHGLLLIEDCALALFSSGVAGKVGRTGDAAIFSLSKSLGFVGGGLLSLAAAPGSGGACLKASGAATRLREIRQSVRVVAARSLHQLGLYGPLVGIHRSRRRTRSCRDDGGELPDMPAGYYFNPCFDADRGLDLGVEKILSTVRWEHVIQERRKNYVRLGDALRGIKEIKILFPHLPEGMCPLSFPMVVSDRDQLARTLQRRGVAAYPWWAGFHQQGLDWVQFPEACWLKHHIVTIPVYQEMGVGSLRNLVQIVKDSVSNPET